MIDANVKEALKNNLELVQKASKRFKEVIAERAAEQQSKIENLEASEKTRDEKNKEIAAIKKPIIIMRMADMTTLEVFKEIQGYIDNMCDSGEHDTEVMKLSVTLENMKEELEKIQALSGDDLLERFSNDSYKTEFENIASAGATSQVKKYRHLKKEFGLDKGIGQYSVGDAQDIGKSAQSIGPANSKGDKLDAIIPEMEKEIDQLRNFCKMNLASKGTYPIEQIEAITGSQDKLVAYNLLRMAMVEQGGKDYNHEVRVSLGSSATLEKFLEAREKTKSKEGGQKGDATSEAFVDIYRKFPSIGKKDNDQMMQASIDKYYLQQQRSILMNQLGLVNKQSSSGLEEKKPSAKNPMITDAKAREHAKKSLQEVNKLLEAKMKECQLLQYERLWLIEDRMAELEEEEPALANSIRGQVNLFKNWLSEVDLYPNKMPAVNYDGPPGTGKTRLTQKFCHIVNIPELTISMSGLSGTSHVLGIEPSYQGANAGQTISGMVNNGTMLMCTTADESCRTVVNVSYNAKGERVVQSEALGAFNEITENDKYAVGNKFTGTSFPIGGVAFTSTTNNIENLPENIANRLDKREAKGPSFEDKVFVLTKTFLESSYNKVGLKKKYYGDEVVDANSSLALESDRKNQSKACVEEVVRYYLENYSTEPGFRQDKANIKKIVDYLNLELQSKSRNIEEINAEPVSRITKEALYAALDKAVDKPTEQMKQKSKEYDDLKEKLQNDIDRVQVADTQLKSGELLDKETFLAERRKLAQDMEDNFKNLEKLLQGSLLGLTDEGREDKRIELDSLRERIKLINDDTNSIENEFDRPSLDRLKNLLTNEQNTIISILGKKYSGENNPAIYYKQLMEDMEKNLQAYKERIAAVSANEDEMSKIGAARLEQHRITFNSMEEWIVKRDLEKDLKKINDLYSGKEFGVGNREEAYAGASEAKRRTVKMASAERMDDSPASCGFRLKSSSYRLQNEGGSPVARGGTPQDQRRQGLHMREQTKGAKLELMSDEDFQNLFPNRHQRIKHLCEKGESTVRYGTLDTNDLKTVMPDMLKDTHRRFEKYQQIISRGRNRAGERDHIESSGINQGNFNFNKPPKTEKTEAAEYEFLAQWDNLTQIPGTKGYEFQNSNTGESVVVEQIPGSNDIEIRSMGGEPADYEDRVTMMIEQLRNALDGTRGKTLEVELFGYETPEQAQEAVALHEAAQRLVSEKPELRDMIQITCDAGTQALINEYKAELKSGHRGPRV